MIFQESETVELKLSVTDDIKKEIIAFTNTNGGKLYIGVDDNGTAIGIDNADEVIQQISNMARDAIKPDITMFIHYDILKQNDINLITVDVQRGTNRPYYLAKKGLRPEGVYVRQGTSSVPATDTAIRQMIKETDGDSFETMRAIEQELTFTEVTKEFELRTLPFGQPQKQTLKLFNSDGIYTNLAFLLSDQCTHTVKVAIFDGTDQNIFKDRREFSGSLLKQLNDVYAYIDIYNATRATFDRLLRIDTRAYPEVAIREALLNSLIHRDYSFSASTLISLYTDRLEFVSIGGLMPGIELDDIKMGISVCRNPQLANIFYRLQLIEAYGTGIRKIFAAYQDTKAQPIIEKTTNAFKIILPNLNFEATDTSKIGSTPELKVLQLLKENESITRNDIEAYLNISSSSASRLLRQLQKSGSIIQIGNARNTKYILPAK